MNLEQTIQRWMLTPGSELTTSAIIRYTGSWVRYEDHVREVEQLRSVLKLISVQDQGCGGNLGPDEIYRAMQTLALEALR